MGLNIYTWCDPHFHTFLHTQNFLRKQVLNQSKKLANPISIINLFSIKSPIFLCENIFCKRKLRETSNSFLFYFLDDILSFDKSIKKIKLIIAVCRKFLSILTSLLFIWSLYSFLAHSFGVFFKEAKWWNRKKNSI